MAEHMPLPPLHAAIAYGNGEKSMLAHIPLRPWAGFSNNPIASLSEMDGLPLTPINRWDTWFKAMWEAAGFIVIDVETSRFKLTDEGRRIVAESGGR